MNRTGKIARMSNAIREEISFRLENGETGPQIVDWLNTLGAVQQVLDWHFDGAPVTEQNLSEWRRGGHQDWKRDQETRAIARDFLNEAEDLHQELDDDIPLLDCMSTTVALALARLLREAMAPVPEDAGPDAFEKRHKAALRVIHEMARWRQGDHHQQLAELRRERLQAERLAAEKAAERTRREEAREQAYRCQRLWDEYTRTLAEGTLTPARRDELEDYFDQVPDLFPDWSPQNDAAPGAQSDSSQDAPDTSTPEAPSKSHQIAPDRTIPNPTPTPLTSPLGGRSSRRGGGGDWWRTDAGRADAGVGGPEVEASMPAPSLETASSGDPGALPIPEDPSQSHQIAPNRTIQTRPGAAEMVRCGSGRVCFHESGPPSSPLP